MKDNGRKQKESEENGTENIGKCSVCWKLNKTPRDLKDNAHYLVEDFEKFSHIKTYLTYQKVEIENMYYKWLYIERF